MIIHNSALAKFRSPIGALKTNESAVIRFKADGAKHVYINVFENGEMQSHKMVHENHMWTYTLIAPYSPMVLWYYFTYELDGKTMYYCSENGITQGEGISRTDPGQAFQLTVYSRDFKTPAEFRRGRMYQIFPDRYANGDQDVFNSGAYYHIKMKRDTMLHKSFDEPVLYTPIGDAPYYSPCDFYGGNLAGIKKNLPELAKMSVTIIYLNPIFEAASNHRYDTADYMNVDPILGTNEDFADLCKEADKYGIKIILDGVFSHTGADSVYFNKNGVYNGKGAWQGEDSPYYNWYSFNEDHTYRSWWGFDTLPEVDEHHPDWVKFIITGDGEHESVLAHWLNLGASGFRLDVADELPDDTIELIRKELKRVNPESLLIGEVWEDATTKQSYGTHRTYALGKALDSVMNYPFRNAAVDFLRGGSAHDLAEFLTAQRLNYPPPMYYSLMNLVSSHDAPRLRTVLSSGRDGEGMSREEQAALQITPLEDTFGGSLQRLAGVLQYTIPGIPSLYYGDEYGMHGLKDPFNRAPLNTEVNDNTYEFFKAMAALREANPILATGYCSFAAINDDILAIMRFCFDDVDCFGDPIEQGCILALVNRGNSQMISITPDIFAEGVDGRRLAQLDSFEPFGVADMLTDNPIDLSNVFIRGNGYKIIKLA